MARFGASRRAVPQSNGRRRRADRSGRAAHPNVRHQGSGRSPCRYVGEPGRVRPGARVALISDGNENLGSVVCAAWQAQQLGIPTDTFPLGGRPKPNLRLESTSLPSQVFSGERFPIDISLTSPRKAKANVEISAEGRPLGSSSVELEQGLNHFRVHASVTTVGAVDLGGKISAPDL